MLVPFRGAPTWRPENNRNICHRILLLKRKHISPEFRHIESNNSFSARTIQVARTWALTQSSFDLHKSLVGPTFQCHAARKLGNSNVLYNKTKNPVELKRCKTSSSLKLLYLMKLKLQKLVIFNFKNWLRHVKTKNFTTGFAYGNSVIRHRPDNFEMF